MERTSSQNWFWLEWIIIIGRFPSVRSDQSVLKWYARVLQTRSVQNGPAPWIRAAQFSAPPGESAGIWRVVAEKMNTAPWNLPFKLARTSSIRQPKTGKWKATWEKVAIPPLGYSFRCKSFFLAFSLRGLLCKESRGHEWGYPVLSNQLIFCGDFSNQLIS